MSTHRHLKRVLSFVLVLVMMLTLLPFSVFAADSSIKSDVIFFGTDRQGNSANLQALLGAMAYEPGLVVLGGDNEAAQGAGSLSAITSEIQTVYPGVQTFYTYAGNDVNVSGDSSNPYAFARTGEVYEGDSYYIYAIDEAAVATKNAATYAANAFYSWANSADPSKVIFIVSHMPLHSNLGDNLGGLTWATALYLLGEERDIVFMWGHNTDVAAEDASVFYVPHGETMNYQTVKQNSPSSSSFFNYFTYINAGYINQGYGSMVVVNENTVDIVRYNASGSVVATHTIDRITRGNHRWQMSGSVDATCTTDGSVTYLCSGCGESNTDIIPAIGHSYITETVDATCTTDGSVTTTCSNCGDTTTEILTAPGHKHVAIVTKPTCQEGGYTTYVCDVCLDTYVADETDVIDHDYIAAVTPPTCVTEGYTTYICKYCTESYVDDFVAMTEHTYSAYVVEPTCSEVGYTVYTCTGCRDSYTGNETATIEHTYSAVVTAPTCTVKGYTTYTCESCGHSYADNYVSMVPHDYVKYTVDASCTKNGSITYICSACDATYFTIVKALGHEHSSVVTAPTCTEAGYTTYSCKFCDDVYTADETDALGHSHEAVVTAPTCTEGGYTTYTCETCGDSYVADETDALGHDYETVVTAPTCTEAGYTTYTCETCGDSYVADETDALGHDYETVVTAPTCTEGGSTTYTCETCGDSYVTDETDALGHNYHAVIVDPTCAEVGYTTYTCSVCEHSYNGDQTAALGHSYTVETVGNYFVYTCSVCGDSYKEEIPTYVYGKVSRITSGENYVITLYSNRNYYAVTHEGNELGLVQVTVSSNKITSEITEDMLWSFDNKELSYEDDGITYYLYSGNADLTVSTTESSTISFSNSRLKVGSYYLRYSGGDVVANRSASTTYLFLETEE